MLVRRTFLDHRHVYSVVNALIVLVRADSHVIARLKIADLRGTARGLEVFSRTCGRNGSDGLVIGLDDDIIVPDFPQHPGERSRVGLVGIARSLRAPRRIPASWITLTGVSATRISAAGISTTRKGDLAKHGSAGQQENRRYCEPARHRPSGRSLQRLRYEINPYPLNADSIDPRIPDANRPLVVLL